MFTAWFDWGFFMFSAGTFGVPIWGLLVAIRLSAKGKGYELNVNDAFGMAAATIAGMALGFAAFGMQKFAPEHSAIRAFIGAIPIFAYSFAMDRVWPVGWKSRPSLKIAMIRAVTVAVVFFLISWILLWILASIPASD
jgi:hypothetical protein